MHFVVKNHLANHSSSTRVKTQLTSSPMPNRVQRLYSVQWDAFVNDSNMYRVSLPESPSTGCPQKSDL
jgi:hypothetical protein